MLFWRLYECLSSLNIYFIISSLNSFPKVQGPKVLWLIRTDIHLFKYLLLHTVKNLTEDTLAYAIFAIKQSFAPIIYLSIFLSIYPSICLSVSLCLSINIVILIYIVYPYLSTYLSIYIYIYIYIYMICCTH